jgi:hypothetical protein
MDIRDSELEKSMANKKKKINTDPWPERLEKFSKDRKGQDWGNMPESSSKWELGSLRKTAEKAL